MNLTDLYSKYIESKKSLVRPNTYKNDYLVTLNHLKRCPWTEVDVLQYGYHLKVYDWGCQNLTKGSCKRLLMQLNASFNWAIKRGIIDLPKSPFEGMASDLKAFVRSDHADINPFTKQERDLIIDCFKNHSNPSYRHYYNYVRFLFFTGCRPSEAIALKWFHIAQNLSEINFNSVIVTGPDKRYYCQGLKSQNYRIFPCNSQVKEILRDCSKDSEFVFSSVKGCPVDIAYFRKNVWAIILSELGIAYKKPYQTRHTFITLCLDAGLDVKDVARLVGNTPQVIYKFYAGRRQNLEVPLL